MASARPRMGYDVPGIYEQRIAPRYAPIADELVRLAAPAAADDVLEIGAGTGLVTRRVAPLARSVVATDKYELMLEHAQECVGDSNVTWLVADYNEPLPFPDGSFDLVLSGLTYVQDAEQPVAEVARVLRPGGRLALSMWGPAYLELELMNRAKAKLGEEPIPAPDPEAACRRLAAAGLHDAELVELELAPEYAGVDDYVAYRRGFGIPAGTMTEDHERYLEALAHEAMAVANSDGSFTQGWRFALVCAKRPA